MIISVFGYERNASYFFSLLLFLLLSLVSKTNYSLNSILDFMLVANYLFLLLNDSYILSVKIKSQRDRS